MYLLNAAPGRFAVAPCSCTTRASNSHHPAQLRGSRHAPRSLACRAAAATPPTTALDGAAPAAPAAAYAAATTWAHFAAAASGEWEGVTASFTPDGSPQQLPEHYVPGDFREWGVELWDWQSQCSSFADAAEEQQYRSVLRRLMPTVGCEADAIAFTEEDAASSSTDGCGDGATVLTVAADGSYSSGAAQAPATGLDGGPSKFQVEHCFVLPDADAAAAPVPKGSTGSNRVRVKVVQQFRRDWSRGAWVLSAVDLHRERYDGPFTGKRELAGCGGGQPGIAQLEPLQQQQLAGTWVAAAAGSAAAAATGSSSSSHGSLLSCLTDSGATPEGVQLTLLPLQAWSAVQLDSDGQLLRAEAGVMHQQQQQRAVSVRGYTQPSSDLADSRLGVETKAT